MVGDSGTDRVCVANTIDGDRLGRIGLERAGSSSTRACGGSRHHRAENRANRGSWHRNRTHSGVGDQRLSVKSNGNGCIGLNHCRQGHSCRSRDGLLCLLSFIACGQFPSDLDDWLVIRDIHIMRFQTWQLSKQSNMCRRDMKTQRLSMAIWVKWPDESSQFTMTMILPVAKGKRMAWRSSRRQKLRLLI